MRLPRDGHIGRGDHPVATGLTGAGVARDSASRQSRFVPRKLGFHVHLVPRRADPQHGDSVRSVHLASWMTWRNSEQVFATAGPAT